MSNKIDIYGGTDPRTTPTYSLTLAAHYLRVPVPTLHAWVHGGYKNGKDGKTHRTKPIIHVDANQHGLLSFWNLAEAYILAGIRRHHGVSLQRTRRAVHYVEGQLGKQRPLLTQDFETDGVSLFVDKLGEGLIDASHDGQLAMKRVLQENLKRVARDTNGLINRIYPWTSTPTEKLSVEINPRRGFGRLVVVGTRVSVQTLSDRFHAGDKMDVLADDYELDEDVIQAALQWGRAA